MSQFDIGFDTAKKLWFIQGSGPTRHISTNIFVHNSNITLKNVMCDTYAWPDVNSEAISHGRLRFYGGSKIVTKGEQAVMDEISITGKDNKFNFIELDGKEVIIRYRLNAMDWELDVDGTLLYTRDLKGKMTGTLLKKRLRFVIHNVHLLYSNIVTLFDPELRVKNPPKITKPSRRERCIQ